MYTADVLRNVASLRTEIANLRDLNDRYASQQDPAPVASRANQERRNRLQEIVRELAAIAAWNPAYVSFGTVSRISA